MARINIPGGGGTANAVSDAAVAAQVTSGTATQAALKAAYASTAAPITMAGTPGVHPDAADATNRLTIPSYQAGSGNYGEGVRLQLMKPYAKNMIAWQIPQPASGDLETYFAMNQGFEPYDVTGTVPVGTTGWSTVGGCTLAVDTSRWVLGSQSGRITWAAGGSGSQAITQPVTGLQVGNVYTLTAWLRAGIGNPPVYLDIDGATPSIAIATDGNWHEVSTTWTATATSHTVRVVLGGTATAGQAANVDLIYVTPQLGSPKSVVWIGAHYEAQDGNGMHGHWSLEVPDSGGSLRTRLEVKFVDSTGKIGVDKTLIQSSSADVVIDCSNSQRLRLRTGPGADRLMEIANDEWGLHPRWRFGAPGAAETGSNAGSNFAIGSWNDADTFTGWPFVIKRSSGLAYFGGTSLMSGQTDGATEGVQINRNHAGSALVINTNLAGATGATGYAHQALDATSRAVSTTITSDSTARFVLYADGKHEFGPGGSTARDANLYRSAVGQLTTDTELKVGTNLRVGSGTLGGGAGVVSVGNATTVPTTNPTGGGVLYASAGALVWRGSNGTVTTVAPA